jgi:hypothetical protein
VRRFLDTSLRLRTACDFQLRGKIAAKSPVNFELPPEGELLAAVQAGIKACVPMFAKRPVTRLKTKVKVVEKAAGQ